MPEAGQFSRCRSRAFIRARPNPAPDTTAQFGLVCEIVYFQSVPPFSCSLRIALTKR